MRIPVSYIVPVAILLLASCRTTTGGLQFRPVSGPETFPEYAIVYFYRPYREFNWGGYPNIFVNGVKKFPLKNETYNVLLLPPGEYEIKAEGSTWGTNWYPGPVTGVFAVEAGLEYYLRVIPTTQGSWNVDYLGSIADDVFNVGNLQLPPWPVSGVDMRMMPKDLALKELSETRIPQSQNTVDQYWEIDEALLHQLNRAQLSELLPGKTVTRGTDYGRWAEYYKDGSTGVGKAWGSWGKEVATSTYTINQDGQVCWTYMGKPDWAKPNHKYCSLIYRDRSGIYYSKDTQNTWKSKHIAKLRKFEIIKGDKYELASENDDIAGSEPTANLSQQTASGSLVTGNDVSGTYRSKLTGSHREESDFEVTLGGNKFYAVSADKEWEIEGALEGDTIKFAWYGPGNSGKGKFKIDSRGNLAGKYTGGWGSGEWILTKSQ